MTFARNAPRGRRTVRRAVREVRVRLTGRGGHTTATGREPGGTDFPLATSFVTAAGPSPAAGAA